MEVSVKGAGDVGGRTAKGTLGVLVLAFFVPGLCGLADRAVFAQGGPPLITDDPGTPGDGNWEINVALTAEKRRTERSYEIPILDINYGLGDRIQLKYEVPWLVLDERGRRTTTGLGNSALGVKWRFFDQDSHRIDMSVYPQFEFNTSDSAKDRGLVDRGVEFVLPFQVEKSFGPISVNPEFGYTFREYHDNEWIYGLAMGYEASKSLELLAEISGTADQDFEDDELVFNFGARCGLSETRTLLLSAGRSFRSDASGEPKFLLYAGIQFIF
ncbi:MAG: transporter [Planctomycetota bacterium]|jgi:hypothetical protein